MIFFNSIIYTFLVSTVEICYLMMGLLGFLISVILHSKYKNYSL